MSRAIIYVHVNIILNILKCVSALPIIMRMSTSKSKHDRIGGFYNENTQKGEHSYKCTELSLKLKEGILQVG